MKRYLYKQLVIIIILSFFIGLSSCNSSVNLFFNSQASKTLLDPLAFDSLDKGSSEYIFGTTSVSAGTIVGTVYGRENGELTNHPINEATVYIEGTNIMTRSDQLGRFKLNEVPVGPHVLIAEKADSTGRNFMLRQSIQITTGETLDVKSLLIRKTGVIFGQVTLNAFKTAAGNTMNQNIDVFIPGSTIIAKTDSNGEFILLDVPEGNYEITFSKTGYQNYTIGNLVVTEGNQAPKT